MEWLSVDSWSATAERKRANGKLMGTKPTRLKEKLFAQAAVFSKPKLNVQLGRIRGDILKAMQQIEDDAAFVELLDSNSIYLSMIKQGALLYTERDQEKRWAEYFQEILDRGPVVVEVVEDIYISIKPPTEDEFVTAIKDLYNGKARWDTK